jgi:hypothetical protein
VTRKETKKVLAGRAEAAEEAAVTRFPSIKRNLLVVVRRKKVMMKVMKGMKRKPVSKSSRKPLRPCALTEVHLCTPLTASLNSGRVRSTL